MHFSYCLHFSGVINVNKLSTYFHLRDGHQESMSISRTIVLFI